MHPHKSVDDFIRSKETKDVIDIYYHSTEIPVFLIDRYGNEIYSASKENGICKFLNEILDEKCPCSQAHLYASRQAEQIGEAYIFSCPAGFIHFTAPLIHGGILAGAIIAGPILLDFADDILIEGMIQKFNLGMGVRSHIRKHASDVPVIDPSRVTHLSKLLLMIASQLMPEGKHILNERNEILEQQCRINENLQEIKNYVTSPSYPYEIEKELLIKVKHGDVIGAKSVLNELLGHILFSSGGNIDRIKLRIQELCTLLSRTALEGGADLDKIFGINYSFIDELSRIKDVPELSYWTVEVLSRFTENVFKLEDAKNAEVIRKAINFINENFTNNISLDIVANAVHLNSSYFSSIFKKETGTSFSNYLNTVRIEESKKLLKDVNNSILDIALSVGFEDQSYYTKVFKKLTGQTPKSYRDGIN